jgi:hypothetical protein
VKLAFVLALVGGLSTPRSVHAECRRIGLSTCFDADTFLPHAGASSFVFVGATETTAVGQLGFGIVATYLTRPVVLAVPTSYPGGTEVRAVDQLWDTAFLGSFGLAPRLEINLALPFVVYRTGTGVSSLTSQSSRPLPRTAMRDARGGLAYRILGPSRAAPDTLSMAARFELAVPTGDAATLAGESGVVALPSLAIEHRHGSFVGGAELGARLRSVAELAGARVGSQLVLAVGAGADLLPDEWLGVRVEILALPTLVAQHGTSTAVAEPNAGPTGSWLVPAEWHVSLRTGGLSRDLSLQLGGGGGLALGDSSVTTPSYRVTFALRYAPRRP